jgi:hypothetical protein
MMQRTATPKRANSASSRELGRRIDGHARGPEQAGAAGDVDQGRARCRLEQLQAGAGAVDDALHVDVDLQIAFLEALLLEIAIAGDAGVVEHDVEPAAAGLGEGGDGLFPLFEVGDIEVDGDAIARADFRQGGFQPGLVDIGQADEPTFAGEPLGGAQADAARGAGDEDAFAPVGVRRGHEPPPASLLVIADQKREGPSGQAQLLSSVGASGPFFLIDSMAFWAEALEL